MAHYEFVNIWPTDFTSMRVAYGEPNVLQCSVQFAYDRFFTSFNESEDAVPLNNPNGIVNSNDIQGGFLPSNPQLKTQPVSDQPEPQLKAYQINALKNGKTK